MLRNLKKLMMLCLLLVGISVNASAFQLTLDYPAQGNVASIENIKLSMPAGMETNGTSYLLKLSGPDGEESVYFDCGSLGYKGLITNPALNRTKPGTYTLTISEGEIIEFYSKAPCEAQTFTWTIGGGGGDPEPTNYSLTLNPSIANGSVSISGNLTQAQAGAEITLIPSADPGYQFDSWNVTNASTSAAITVTDNKFTMPAANVNISANFSVATPSSVISLDFGTTAGHMGVTPVGSTQGTCNIEGRTYQGISFSGAQGTNVSNKAPTLRDKGSLYPSDYLIVNTNNTFTMTAPSGETFKEVKLYFLSNSSGTYYYNGASTPSGTHVSWSAGSYTLENETDHTQSSYGTWSNGGNSSISELTFTNGNNRNLFVWKIEFTFVDKGGGDPEPTNYSLFINSSIANGSVSISGNLTQAQEGDEITLIPSANTGYEFGSWNVTSTLGTVSVNPSTNKFTMPAANVTISATFTKKSSPSGWTFDAATFTPALNTPVESIGTIKIDYNGIDPIGTSGADNGMNSFTGVVGTISNGITTYEIQAGNDIFNAGYLTVEVFDAHGRYTITEPGTWTLHFNAGILRAYAGSKPANAEMNYTFIVGAPAPTGDDVTINPAIQYATYYNSAKAVRLPAGVKGCLFGPNNMTGKIELVEYYDGDGSENIVPAGEAIVLMGSGDITLDYVAADDPNIPGFTMAEVGSNMLAGFDEPTLTVVPDIWVSVYGLTPGEAATDCKHYGLSLDTNDKNVGFYWMNSTGAAFTSGAHKAYLSFPAAGYAMIQSMLGGGIGGGPELAPSRFLFKQGEATAIKSVEAKVDNRMMYNLNGQRVNASAKGIVIMNGKKVVK